SVVLGAGGFSVVLPGRSKAEAEIFCNTAVKKNHMSDVRNEVRHLISCRGHPNILQYRGMFFLEAEEEAQFETLIAARHRRRKWEGPAKYALVFELFTLGDMWQLVNVMGVIPESTALSIMIGLFSALAYIHEKKIVHRDVKSENIMMRCNGDAVLADFGLAMVIPAHQEICQRAGSAGYAAPEQLASDCKYGLKVDVFGAGVCLYFALARSLPFNGVDKEAIIAATRNCRPDFESHLFREVSTDTIRLGQPTTNNQQPTTTYKLTNKQQ
ncbi:unnamed protein product, partial [Polarella glacialis]